MRTTFFAMVAAWLAITPAFAGPLYSFSASGPLSGPGDFVQRTDVTTNTSIVIDQVGLWDLAGDGLAQSHGFRLRDQTNNTDLLNIIIGAGTGTLIGGFRYIDIADISVAAGITLSLLSDNRAGNNTDPMALGGTGLVFDPSVTLNGSGFENNANDSTIPALNFGNTVIAGANLLIREQATAVPEPATIALFGAGLAGLGALRRRRKTKA